MPPVPRPPRPALPTPGHRRATVVGAGSFGTAVAVLLARAGLRVTLQTRTREQADQLGGRARERDVPAGRRVPAGAARRARHGRARALGVRLPRRALARARRGHRRARRRSGCTPPRGDRLAGQGPRAAGRHAAHRAPAPAYPRHRIAVRRRPGPRARDGLRGRGARRRLDRRGAGQGARHLLHRAPAWCASSRPTRSASSSPARPRTPRRSPRARRRRRA